MKKFKTVAIWPKALVIKVESHTDTTEDYHDSYEEAKAVKDKLLSEGFGGESEYFPISVSIRVL
jgi:hypothetical protein